MKYNKILIPRLMDENNFNPQNKNAQNILAYWSDSALTVLTLYYNKSRQDIAHKTSIRLIKLWRWHFWKLSVWFSYQQKVDAIFYPGFYAWDDLGWRFRDWTGRRVPIIVTLEGLVGDEKRQQEYTAWAGHQVYCQYVDKNALARIDRLYERADHIIAISPFLEKMGKKRYGDKFSIAPLGLDSSIFYSDLTKKNKRITIISAGRLYSNKRPEIFIELALRFPQVDFVWYGWGELLESLTNEAKKLGLINLFFLGAVDSNTLAEAMRKAHLFVLPSKSEGVPKVTQEAAACGLVQVIFGYYEAPTVINNKNGYVVWNDEEFINAISLLIQDKHKISVMGESGAKMAKHWRWDKISLVWINHILEKIER